MADSHLIATAHVVKRHHAGKRQIWQTHIVESAVNNQSTHIRLHVEGMRRIGCVEYEIELKGPWVLPVFVLGAYEAFRSQC